MHLGKLFLAVSLTLTSSSFAAELLCASKKDQVLYFTTGQVRVVAEINNGTNLSKFSLSTTGSNNLGVSGEDLKGRVSGNWVRFHTSDAWCDYFIALPKGFSSKETAVMFLDAECEESSRYTVRLNCSIQ